VPRDHHLDAQPQRARDAAHQDSDDGSHGVALRLLYAPAPTPQVREVSLEAVPIADIDADR
jgi:hypothetical protein